MIRWMFELVVAVIMNDIVVAMMMVHLTIIGRYTCQPIMLHLIVA